MSKSCFVCTTPYQLIAAITIAYYDSDASDIVIVPQFRNAAAYAKRLEKVGLFDRVIYSDFEQIDRYKSRKTSIGVRLGIVENYLRVERIVPHYLGDASYSKIYISSQAIVGRLISLYYRKRGAEIIYFDDGEGSYDYKKIYSAVGIDRTIRGLLYGKRSLELGNKRMLYFPRLYEKMFGESDNVTQIPNWIDDPRLLEKINYVCGYSSDAEFQTRFVLLDTIPSESFEPDGQVLYRELFDVCVNELRESLTIKRHPRDKSQRDLPCQQYQHSDIPFEIICANSQIEKKVLISACSSAILMPKIMFDQEPVVILLHHITGVKIDDNDKREEMIDYILGMYEHKDRVIVPETTDEFMVELKRLKQVDA